LANILKSSADEASNLIYDSFEEYLNNYKAFKYIMDDEDLIIDDDELNALI